ncbi:sigma-70 family RNA polymerase sigma factor [Clostridium botulinum]|uniref:Sigma-70 family RNA polymerase sigma factor n=1 Tax=Clostridium botulinum TaxID=1491 RepID=A0A6B4G716_CLOBO|nr:sigma-70 family RNA polymerase sigma factor [Clostridium botulinum]MBN3382921.1 sigma-70 family RNA polymerase sigma factor [Clostridium botulinum]NFF90087.1 sigma-70 family RNA polymerase sigma factor [Clostridium botulinum]NFG16873.1 sigma-70 family RNA polymerase sigma factor [Clostridium botulinum]NFG30638.1 sigma-70 family RNA polymerase sigma factor [Clostridium botulinum]NFG33781.1 sigma-70 family RNA polymerase sigma factor [Clostridium botulinum]
MHQLIKKYREGDNRALQKIIDNFIPLILKEASKYKIKCYDYEDLVQHGYLSVIKAANMYKGEDKNFKFYCIKAIKQNYKALLKDEIKHHREIPEDKDIYTYEFTLEDEILAYEKIKEVYKVLDSLTKEERNIIEGFYFKDKTIKSIAKQNNKSYNNIRYQKDKVIKKLQNSLTKHI